MPYTTGLDAREQYDTLPDSNVFMIAGVPKKSGHPKHYNATLYLT